MRPEWEDLTVFWMDTGDAYPETYEQMAQVARMVPHFKSETSDVRTDISKNGAPSDIVVSDRTAFGHIVRKGAPIKMRTQFECCRNNLWAPMQHAMKMMGATEVIRGQRLNESYRVPVRSGFVADGVRYTFPIESWTQSEVSQYLASIGVEEPEHYKTTEKSLDCMHCTAYLEERIGQMGYMSLNHPEAYRETMSTLKQIQTEVRRATAPLEMII